MPGPDGCVGLEGEKRSLIIPKYRMHSMPCCIIVTATVPSDEMDVHVYIWRDDKMHTEYVTSIRFGACRGAAKGVNGGRHS